jgi:hypothetical protein
VPQSWIGGYSGLGEDLQAGFPARSIIGTALNIVKKL